MLWKKKKERRKGKWRVGGGWYVRISESEELGLQSGRAYVRTLAFATKMDLIVATYPESPWT